MISLVLILHLSLCFGDNGGIVQNWSSSGKSILASQHFWMVRDVMDFSLYKTPYTVQCERYVTEAEETRDPKNKHSLAVVRLPDVDILDSFDVTLCIDDYLDATIAGVKSDTENAHKLIFKDINNICYEREYFVEKTDFTTEVNRYDPETVDCSILEEAIENEKKRSNHFFPSTEKKDDDNKEEEEKKTLTRKNDKLGEKGKKKEIRPVIKTWSPTGKYYQTIMSNEKAKSIVILRRTKIGVAHTYISCNTIMRYRGIIIYVANILTPNAVNIDRLRVSSCSEKQLKASIKFDDTDFAEEIPNINLVLKKTDGKCYKRNYKFGGKEQTNLALPQAYVERSEPSVVPCASNWACLDGIC